MNKYILWPIVIIIAAGSACLVALSVGQTGARLIDLGTFGVISLTLIALVFYANDTNRMTRISQSKWQRESVLNAGYSMVAPVIPAEKAGFSSESIIRRR